MTDIIKEDSITMNLKLLTFAMALLIGVIGFFMQRTLDSIDENLVNLKIELQNKSNVMANHETRIQILEKYYMSNK